MQLEQRIDADLKDAMRAGDATRKNTLRLIRAAAKNASIEAGGGPLEDAVIIGILQKQAKQRADSIEQFEKAEREDLASVERSELAIIREYLPDQLSDQEIEAAVREQIKSVGASGMADIGRVMGPLMKALHGQADGQRISSIVRQLLGN